MLKKILIGLLVVIAILLIYAATRPDDFRVERTATIRATPEAIFPHINDMHAWGAWSPWEKLDPAMKRTYGGAESGKGATYAWEGNSQVGQGRMEIVESNAPSKVKINLDFLKPMEGHNIAEFTLQPKGDTTDVTWSMHGPQPYVAKVMCIFIDMDKIIGKSFEEGLASLKTIAESSPPPAPAPPVTPETTTPPATNG